MKLISWYFLEIFQNVVHFCREITVVVSYKIVVKLISRNFLTFREIYLFFLLFTGVANTRRGIVGQYGCPRKPYS